MTLEDCIKKITRYKYLDFMRYPNVVAVGCGNKFINGINTGKLCIQVFVIKKYHKNCLGEGCVPSYYQGIQTDIIESGIISVNRNKFSSRQQVEEGFSEKIRPVKMSYGIGAYDPSEPTEGTVGCIVNRTDESGNLKFYILGNNHVLADSNELPIGTPIIQPGDGKIMTDRIAKLSEFIPIKFMTSPSTPENYVDAAIAEIDSLNLVRPNIAFITIPKGINTEPKFNDSLKLSGAVSGYVTGIILSVGVSEKVRYDEGLAYYVDQIVLNKEVDDGDSGAMVLDNDNKLVGMVFAGHRLTYINKIYHIQNLLKVNFFTQA